MGILAKKLQLNNLVENTQPLNNPYRGMYCIHKYYVDKPADIKRMKYYVNQKLILVELNLSAYRLGDIDKQGFDNIEKLFEEYRKRKLHIIVRFLYDFDGNGIKNEPESLVVIHNHIRQLSDLLRRYDDLIFVVQGLLIGSWGEMHGTRYRDKGQHVALYRDLLQSCGEHAFLAVRCPYMWRYISGSDKPVWKDSRLGLFNDAIMGSDTDLGTYSAQAGEDYQGKWDRAKEIAFQNKLCEQVPNGGEILYSDKSTDMKYMWDELCNMKVSYLNCEHDLKIIDRWKRVDAGLMNQFWSKHSLYEYIAEHIGYRYHIENVSGKRRRFGGKLRADFTLTNEGTAPCYRDLSVSIVVSDGDNEFETAVPADLKCVMPGGRMPLSIILKLPTELKKSRKRLEVGLKIVADNKEEIRLGNAPESETMVNSIGIF